MNTIHKIVAVGGGEIGRRKLMPDGSIYQYPVETIEIEQEIVRLSGKKNPKLLLIATASGDSPGYLDAAQRHFGETLGCLVSWLPLIARNPSSEEIREAILGTDIIYVGGGNTNEMMKVWKDKGVDKILKEAFDKGIVLSGISAGANCWFEHYSTDSVAIDSGEEHGTRLSLGVGLGFVPGICAPHTLTEKLRLPYMRQALLEKYPDKVAYGIDDYAAVVFENGKARSVISAVGRETDAKVQRLSVSNGKVVESVICEGAPCPGLTKPENAK